MPKTSTVLIDDDKELGLYSRNKRMLNALEQLVYAASTKQPVLLLGETGVGKGVFAKVIHQAGSRAKKPFIRFQTNFANHDLVASELFGHQRGAFTGATELRKALIEEAHNGSLFIDEVDQLPSATQVALLETLQSGTYRSLGNNQTHHSDFRLITASNKRERELVGVNALREDFYHRIAHYTIRIPPLRERPEDIKPLAEEFAQSLITKEQFRVQGVTPQALSYLGGFSWPGNVRQLQAVVEGGVYRAEYEKMRYVEVSHIDLPHSSTKRNSGSFRTQVRAFEEQLVLKALAENNDNQSEAARALQLDRTSLRRILQREG